MKSISILLPLMGLLCVYFVDHSNAGEACESICSDDSDNPVCGVREFGRKRRLFKNECAMEKFNCNFKLMAEYKMTNMEYCNRPMPEPIPEELPTEEPFTEEPSTEEPPTEEPSTEYPSTTPRTPPPVQPIITTTPAEPCSQICTEQPNDPKFCATQFFSENNHVIFGILTECGIEKYNCRNNRNLTLDDMEDCIEYRKDNANKTKPKRGKRKNKKRKLNIFNEHQS